MEELLITIFSEKGIIYGLFVLMVLMIIYKGIPYAAGKFDMIVKQFADITLQQQNTFKDSLDKISETFLNQIATSNEWHKSHNEHLARIEELIKNPWKK
jgi:predicted PurR-regulated permease PerM